MDDNTNNFYPDGSPKKFYLDPDGNKKEKYAEDRSKFDYFWCSKYFRRVWSDPDHNCCKNMVKGILMVPVDIICLFVDISPGRRRGRY